MRMGGRRALLTGGASSIGAIIPDAVVTAAPIVAGGRLLDASPDDWRRTLDRAGNIAGSR